MTDGTLFDMDPPARSGKRKLTPDQARTIRQLQALRRRIHPLSLAFKGWGLRLHSDAPPADDRLAAGPRCGTCRFYARVTSNGNHAYPKCVRGTKNPYVTHGAATDLRAWWPGCEHWEPKGETDA